MKILIEKLSLRNFKGIKQFSVNFDDKETSILGDNATGKTTLMDSFLWLLFGKDSTGRTDFNIKTLDENGKPIHRLEHEVEAVLSVNGKPVTLKRVYTEKWTKPRGTNEETLTSHTTDFSINGAPLSTKKEYDAEIASMIPESIFRMITNPFYFTGLSALEQKTMLFEMAGGITDEEIGALKPEFAELFDLVTGKTLDRYKAEVSAKKRTLKDELAGIPGRTDEVQRNMPAVENWGDIEVELAQKKDSVSKIDFQIADRSKIAEEEYKTRSAIQRNINDKKLERDRIETKIVNELQTADRERNNVIRDLDYQIQSVNSDLRQKELQIPQIQQRISNLDLRLTTLRGQYRTINATTLTYNEGAFSCPTCLRPLEPDDIETKRLEMEANFNKSKSKQLQENQHEGLTAKNGRESLQKDMEVLSAEIKSLNDKRDLLLSKKQAESEKVSNTEKPDPKSIIAQNPDIIRLSSEISKLEAKLQSEPNPVDVSDLIEGKKTLNEAINSLAKRLANRDLHSKSKARLRELSEQQSKLNQELTDCERIEFIIQDFQKTKDAELMKKINGMFSLVSFSFVDEQLNGGEKITCICSVDGVPFQDLNNAMKINAGLDIINAICRSQNVSAPIWLDNRESVINILPVESQIINLIVKEGASELLVKQDNMSADDITKSAVRERVKQLTFND
ncbi:MAG: AAA family ATPase [Mangrovibacterium sp.]